MLGLNGFLAAIALAGSLWLPYVAANADPSTGHVRNYRPSDAWLSKNKPNRMTREIQASECGMNTRLAYPNVQLFSWFKVNQSENHYHGCPYGDCWAYTVFPTPDDLVVDFTWSHVFFWHGTGGVPGTGVKSISDPQTGAFGYEQSLSGKFIDGPTPANTIQALHDENYPGFHPDQLQRWPKGASDRFLWSPEPKHLKCGLPCEPNKDPGMDPGVYGSKEWSPAPASRYPPPPNWKPTARDKCPSGGTTPPPDECGSFCSCVAQCKDDNCISKCPSKAKGVTCDRSQCPAAPAPSPNHPKPGNDPDKCLNYCTCTQHCNGDKQCIQSKCKSINHGCKTAQCSGTDSSSAPPPSGGQGQTKKGNGSVGNNNGSNGTTDDKTCKSYCKCASKCKDDSCKGQCENAQKCANTTCKPSKKSSRSKSAAC